MSAPSRWASDATQRGGKHCPRGVIPLSCRISLPPPSQALGSLDLVYFLMSRCAAQQAKATLRPVAAHACCLFCAARPHTLLAETHAAARPTGQSGEEEMGARVGSEELDRGVVIGVRKITRTMYVPIFGYTLQM